VNTTRRYLCEALSFQYRYVPIGLLEHLPGRLNDRAPAFRGRNDLGGRKSLQVGAGQPSGQPNRGALLVSMSRSPAVGRMLGSQRRFGQDDVYHESCDFSRTKRDSIANSGLCRPSLGDINL